MLTPALDEKHPDFGPFKETASFKVLSIEFSPRHPKGKVNPTMRPAKGGISCTAIPPFMWMLFLQSSVEQSNFEISLTSGSLVLIGGRQQFGLLYTKALDFVIAEIDAVILSSFDRGIDKC